MFSRLEKERSPSVLPDGPLPSPLGEGETVIAPLSWSRAFCRSPRWNRKIGIKIMMKVKIRREGI
jgi:hypothetical protein